MRPFKNIVYKVKNILAKDTVETDEIIISQTKEVFVKEEQGDSINSQYLMPFHTGESIRIVLFIQHPAVWLSWKSFYEALSADNAFNVKVVLTPFIHHLSSEAVVYDELRQFLIKEGVSFFTFDCFSFSTFKPHIVFLQNPYESTRPKSIHIEQIKNAGARIAYIPYGLEVSGGAWNLSAQFDLDVHQRAWRIFARSNHHKEMFAQYCSVGNGHVVVTGHPKFDQTSLNPKVCDNTLECIPKIRGRKVVLWTPHFSVGLPATWSTYRIYSEKIFHLFKENTELFLLIRPHPLFFQTMRSNGVWDANDEKEFRFMIQESDNLVLDENPSYAEAFSVADALMADAGSFLLEFLPTNKPILYLKHPDGLGLIDEAKQLRGYYIASNEKEIDQFISMFKEGLDPLQKERKATVTDAIYGLDQNIGQTICEHIKHALYTGDDVTAIQNFVYNTQDMVDENFLPVRVSEDLNYVQYMKNMLNMLFSKLTTYNSIAALDLFDEDIISIFASRADKVDLFLSPSRANNVFFIQNNNVNVMYNDIYEVKPFEKYNCLLVINKTSTLVNDQQFLRFVDKFKPLLKMDGYLILIDSFSREKEQVDLSGKAKYRLLVDVQKIIISRGFSIFSQDILIDDQDVDFINNMSVFKLN